MFDELKKHLTPERVRDYMIEIRVTEDWVCFKNPAYPPNSTSRQENRFNSVGQDCYYAASGQQCAKAEVPNHSERDLYRITPHTIHVFDLPKCAYDLGCEAEFLKSKSEGGYKVCQELADHLHTEVAVTGIIYRSYQMAQGGTTGYCLALLPNSGELVEDTYFIKVASSSADVLKS